ncbi:MAG TPA: hypothetical protein VGB30_00180 [bacterium]|jgi:hypothetical protein
MKLKQGILILFAIAVTLANSQDKPAMADSVPLLHAYDNLNVYYGDPHTHTCLSDSDESPDYALRYARDVSGLDWVCSPVWVECLN